VVWAAPAPPTTDEHAGLIRRTGARRVTLVFDGDAAGQKAAYKALHGLLPLELPIDVVTLEGGEDPCDVLVREGARPLLAAMELARGWFEFLVAGLKGKTGAELSREADRVLELLARLPKPVHRHSLLGELARATGIPAEALRAQGNMLLRGRSPAPVAPAAPRAAAVAGDARTQSAWKQLVGALLVDPSLLPLVNLAELACPDAELARVLDALLALYADEQATIDCASVLTRLGDDPARALVVPLHEHARAAESARMLLEGQLRFLRQRALEERRRALEPALAREGQTPEEEREQARELYLLKTEELRAHEAQTHAGIRPNAVPTPT
jgi:DNA primase